MERAADNLQANVAQSMAAKQVGESAARNSINAIPQKRAWQLTRLWETAYVSFYNEGGQKTQKYGFQLPPTGIEPATFGD